jgi:hypothetical protein
LWKIGNDPLLKVAHAQVSTIHPYGLLAAVHGTEDDFEQGTLPASVPAEQRRDGSPLAKHVYTGKKLSASQLNLDAVKFQPVHKARTTPSTISNQMVKSKANENMNKRRRE